MIKVGLIGLGRTGMHIASEIFEQNNMELVAAICSPKSEKRGMTLGSLIFDKENPLVITSSEELKETIFKTKPDVIVDFSTPNATMENSRLLSSLKVNIVIGTTGFTDEELNELRSLPLKYHNGIVYAPNITLGVNTLMLLSNIAANILSNYDFQITETHHKHKKDSPSGTAKKIAMEMERGLESSGSDYKVIPINSIRAGGVIGKHEIQVIGEYDKIEISHESFSRKVFAQGAVQGINYVYKKTGYFEMREVLDLKKVLNDCLNSEEIMVL
ncbi:MAG: 4-hydroxy-tetrahydrodipicolinate reductase [Solirubrobacterales bacterium]